MDLVNVVIFIPILFLGAMRHAMNTEGAFKKLLKGF